LLRGEALQLQGFPVDWNHPVSREAAFRAFGNAVHCELVEAILGTWLGTTGSSIEQFHLGLAKAVGANDAPNAEVAGRAAGLGKPDS
jgi:hypothetical protein